MPDHDQLVSTILLFNRGFFERSIESSFHSRSEHSGILMLHNQAKALKEGEHVLIIVPLLISENMIDNVKQLESGNIHGQVKALLLVSSSVVIPTSY